MCVICVFTRRRRSIMSDRFIFASPDFYVRAPVWESRRCRRTNRRRPSSKNKPLFKIERMTPQRLRQHRDRKWLTQALLKGEHIGRRSRPRTYESIASRISINRLLGRTGGQKTLSIEAVRFSIRVPLKNRKEKPQNPDCLFFFCSLY